MSVVLQLEDPTELSNVALTGDTAPPEVKRILEDDLPRHAKELKENEETETIFYCSPPPPLYKNLMTTRFSLGVMLASLSFLLLGLVAKAPEWIIGIVIFYAIGIFWGLYIGRAELFGYRVVTNLRAAYVIPRKTLLFFNPDVSRQVFFHKAFEQIIQASPLMLNKCLAVAVSSKGKSDTGTILFNGYGSMLTFRNTPHFASLTENIVAIVQQMITSHPSPDVAHMEVQESYVPKDGQKATKYHLIRGFSIFMFFIFGLLFGVTLVAVVVGDWEAAAVFFGIGIVTLSIGYVFVCSATIQKEYFVGMVQNRTTLIGSATHGQELVIALDA